MFRVRAFAAFGDEAVDPGGDDGQRDRPELEHRVVEGADVEFRPQRFLRLFAARRAAQGIISLVHQKKRLIG